MDSNPDSPLSRHAVERSEALLSACPPRRVLLVPTVASTVDALAGWRAKWPNLQVVAPGLPGGLAPYQLISMMSGTEARPDRIVLYADQLVSPAHARIPIRRGQSVLYVSGLEALLVVRHGYALSCALPPEQGEDSECTDAHGAFALSLDFLDRCDALGDAWRVRASQSERTVEARMGAARRELRYLESAVLHAAADDPAATVTDVLSRIRASHKQMKQAIATEADHAA